ncbi:MAG: hypothetical protein V3T70_07180, partial [Phycisphaerae bacterium]
MMFERMSVITDASSVTLFRRLRVAAGLFLLGFGVLVVLFPDILAYLVAFVFIMASLSTLGSVWWPGRSPSAQPRGDIHV